MQLRYGGWNAAGLNNAVEYGIIIRYGNITDVTSEASVSFKCLLFFEKSEIHVQERRLFVLHEGEACLFMKTNDCTSQT